MATIETYELETFRRYRLDADAVRICRAKLDCSPPTDLKSLRPISRKLERLNRQIEKLQAEVELISGALREAGVWTGFGWQPETAAAFQWHLEEKRWGEDSYEGTWYCGDKILEEYTERPQKESALKAWNRFLIAIRHAPERLLRIRKEGYVAEYLDKRKRVVRIWEEQLSQPWQRIPEKIELPKSAAIGA